MKTVVNIILKCFVLTFLILPFNSCTLDPVPALSGTVTDAETGAALNNASVSIILQNKTFPVTTDIYGMYKYERLGSGSFNISVSCDGYEEHNSTVTLHENDFVYNIQLSKRKYNFTGVVKDADTKEVLPGVTVMSSNGSQTTTNNSGAYTFENHPKGAYTLTFSKDGYNGKTEYITIPDDSYLSTELVSKTLNITVAVDDYLAISDGIYFWLTFGSATVQYYYDILKTSEISSDEEIISALKKEEIIDINYTGIYGYNHSENTSYTICAIGIDAQGRTGPLYKRTVSTKGASSQPQASIDIKSISGSRIDFGTTKNSYCNSYSLIVYNATSYDYPDIYFAARVYKYGNPYTDNKSLYVTIDPSNPYTWIATLGYDASGNNSGVVNVKAVNNTTGEVLRSTAIDVRSDIHGRSDKAVKEKDMSREKLNAIIEIISKEKQ
ncbi:MAG: carboxypeptidase-like regulatory domain-containing protein [Tannerella sp.]|jgi:hypothetical protein|nr:carboxypeptidase-like regulatory domain-containing protein [Tannerella sp.]